MNSVSGCFKVSFMVRAMPEQELGGYWELSRPTEEMGIRGGGGKKMETESSGSNHGDAVCYAKTSELLFCA